MSWGQPDPSTHGTGVYVSHIAPAPRRHATPSREPPAVSAPPRRASASSGPNQAYLGVASRSAVHRQVEAEVSGGDSRQPVSKCPNRPKTRAGWGSRITGRSACRGRGSRPSGVPACPVPGLPYLPSHTHKDTPAGFVHLEYTPTGRQVLPGDHVRIGPDLHVVIVRVGGAAWCTCVGGRRARRAVAQWSQCHPYDCFQGLGAFGAGGC